jgi:hypothetical protein
VREERDGANGLVWVEDEEAIWLKVEGKAMEGQRVSRGVGRSRWLGVGGRRRSDLFKLRSRALIFSTARKALARS